MMMKQLEIKTEKCRPQYKVHKIFRVGGKNQGRETRVSENNTFLGLIATHYTQRCLTCAVTINVNLTYYGRKYSYYCCCYYNNFHQRNILLFPTKHGKHQISSYSRRCFGYSGLYVLQLDNTNNNQNYNPNLATALQHVVLILLHFFLLFTKLYSTSFTTNGRK